MAKLTRQEVPKDILRALEVDAIQTLDEVIIDAKCDEASGINNEGFWAQLDYLRNAGWKWNEIRKALGIEEDKHDEG